MGSWEHRYDNNEYLKSELERTKTSIKDKEIGILGQAEAAKDYEEILKRLNNNN